MRRREFIIGGGATAAMPLVSRAQQATPVIGFLNSEAPDTYERRAEAFRRGLKQVGYVDGQNVSIEYRWAESQYERIPALMADLIQRQVAVIVVNGPAAYAAKTPKIPVVFFTGGDPVALGLVASLNKPGGNVTGATVLNIELTSKRLEILREALPQVKSFALLVNPNNGNAKLLSEQVRSTALALGLRGHVLEASNQPSLEAVFAQLTPLGVGGLIIGADGFFSSHSSQLAALAKQHKMPTIFQYRDFVESGGFLSYGADIAEAYVQLGIYAGRILKGERPADLPVVQSTKVELLVNLKAAKALGVDMPQTLLARADEVIE
jgi:ABC-type uncharacterized transport system substrate-binding protein